MVFSSLDKRKRGDHILKNNKAKGGNFSIRKNKENKLTPSRNHYSKHSHYITNNSSLNETPLPISTPSLASVTITTIGSSHAENLKTQKTQKGLKTTKKSPKSALPAQITQKSQNHQITQNPQTSQYPKNASSAQISRNSSKPFFPTTKKRFKKQIISPIPGTKNLNQERSTLSKFLKNSKQKLFVNTPSVTKISKIEYQVKRH